MYLISLWVVAAQTAAKADPGSDGLSPLRPAVGLPRPGLRHNPWLGSLSPEDLSRLPRWIVKWSPMGLWDLQLLHLTFSAEYRPAESNLAFGLEGAYLKESLYRQNNFSLQKDLRPGDGFMLRPFGRLYLKSTKPGFFTFIELQGFYKYAPFRFYSWYSYKVQDPQIFYRIYEALPFVRRSYGFIINAGFARMGLLPGWWAELYGGMGLRNRELFFRDPPGGLYLGDDPLLNMDVTWRREGLTPTVHFGVRLGIGR